MVYSSTLLLLCCVLIEALSLLLLVVTSTTVQTKIVLRAHDFGSRVIVVAHHGLAAGQPSGGSASPARSESGTLFCRP